MSHTRALAILSSAFLTAVAAPAACPAQEFVPLFNGKDLSGWTGATDGYAVEDGILYCIPGSGGKLFTEDEYGDFVLRFEFRLTPGANNGIGLRTPTEGDPAYAGMEIQVLDNSAEKYNALQPYQYHGSVYGVVPAKKGYLKPAGEWNSQEISCIGRRVKVVLNGETIVDADLDEASEGGTMDHREHPGLARKSGHIALLGHGDRVDFRNMEVKSLDGESE
ncbi:3-keto-disaccharide hydrolase [Tautonia sociabilis]|uniref:DUF1080 domain-containing protein n=1 Tax=Tautonia sociabilis TaxID=2080755 RepID=A0A432MPE9_9BACT|nr:DUF1080 domain-containing protein [Tautonia sociabilis]RUL89321.1 DUF1080 domain-containing protein [Tautonia sociabilis]